MKKLFLVVITAVSLFSCKKYLEKIPEADIVAVDNKSAVSNQAAAAATPFSNIFYDGFDAGSSLNTKWAKESGTDPNSTLCVYDVNVPKVGAADGKSCAIITATTQYNNAGQPYYKSGRMHTYANFAPTPGDELKFESRIKLIAVNNNVFTAFSQTRGAWPAFWLVNPTAWPTNGEIDIMEGYSFGGGSKKFTSNIFYGTQINNPLVGYSSARTYPNSFSGEGWHTYTCYWKNEGGWHTVTIFIDGVYFTYFDNNSFAGKLFIERFNAHNVVLNLNVGCTNYLPLFNNNSNLNLFNNTQMWVDYVAVDKRRLY